MPLDMYVIVALVALLVGAALILLGGRWLWRLIGAGFIVLGLAMLGALRGVMLIPM
jgi:hypothetical protein